MDDGSESIADTALQAQLRTQARMVYAQAIALAAIATALAMLVPSRG